MKTFLFTLFGLLLFLNLKAQGHIDTKGFSLIIDQDFFVEPFEVNEDRNYTMGVGFVFSGFKTGSNKLVLPYFRSALDSLTMRPFAKAALSKYINSFEFLSTNFTPGEIETANVLPNDRPYGSLIAFGSTRLNIYNEAASNNIKNQFSLSTSFHLGFLGLPVGEAVQKGIHGKSKFGSCFGNAVDICAPGVIVVAIRPSSGGPKFFYFSGTSAATALVSGVAALICALDPSVKHYGVKQILKRTAIPDITIDHSQGQNHRERFIGSGRIDAGKALEAAASRIGVS